MLREPTDEEADEISGIFPCALTSSWEVEKVRWMRQDVTPYMFANWDSTSDECVELCSTSRSAFTDEPNSNRRIAHPYPPPRYCRPPLEDITGTSVCHPIDKTIFDAPTAAPRRNAILAPAPLVATAAPLPHPASHFSCSTPSDRSSPEALPTPPGLFPPGLAPLPPTAAPFVPALQSR